MPSRGVTKSPEFCGEREIVLPSGLSFAGRNWVRKACFEIGSASGRVMAWASGVPVMRRSMGTT